MKEKGADLLFKAMHDIRQWAVGGLLTGVGVSALYGPVTPICAIAVVLVGTVAGGVAGDAVSDFINEELEALGSFHIGI